MARRNQSKEGCLANWQGHSFDERLITNGRAKMALIENKDEKCMAILKLIEEGKGVCESCREIGVSEKTFYRWRRDINQ